MGLMEDKILKILEGTKKPLNENTLAKKANGYNKQRGVFSAALANLVKDGKISESRGRYEKARTASLVEAEIVKIAGNFGFAKPTEENMEDVFIPGRLLLGTMPGDKVMIKVSRNKEKNLLDGEVTKITEEVNRSFVGVFAKGEDGTGLIIPDDYLPFSLVIKGNPPKGVKVGDKVLARVAIRSKHQKDNKVEILEHFGNSEKASVCAEAILAESGITREFSEEAIEQAKALASGAGIHPKELEVRTDLRDWNVFTIDGADTKDIDDAISIETTKNGWQLGVHIADVSYYVTRQCPLDKDAFNRGTSVYFANQVVPMLPVELSNGICSLNPNEDRLSFSGIMDLSSDGDVESFNFEKTVISSRIKGVYSEINQILSGEAIPTELAEKYKDQMDSLREMKTLAEVLNKKRLRRHAMNLESTESKMIIDDSGKITDIVPRTTGISENMIEEFMLITNQCAATFAQQKDVPFLYRVHEKPKDERLETLFALLDSLGVSYQRPKNRDNIAKSLSDVLKAVLGTPLAGIVNHSMLRTMAKAKYSPENLGHFGLALDNYSHFTSPIRRYPDLAIHRIMSAMVTGMRTDNIEKHFRSWVETTGTQSTNKEIGAMTTERNVEDCYKAEFMKDLIGEEFDGIVSSTTSFGIFIELANTVEGLVHIDKLPGGNWFYDGIITFQNHDGGQKLRIGDSVRINVVNAQVGSGRIDFELVETKTKEVL